MTSASSCRRQDCHAGFCTGANLHQLVAILRWNLRWSHSTASMLQPLRTWPPPLRTAALRQSRTCSNPLGTHSQAASPIDSEYRLAQEGLAALLPAVLPADAGGRRFDGVSSADASRMVADALHENGQVNTQPPWHCPHHSLRAHTASPPRCLSLQSDIAPGSSLLLGTPGLVDWLSTTPPGAVTLALDLPGPPGAGSFVFPLSCWKGWKRVRQTMPHSELQCCAHRLCGLLIFTLCVAQGPAAR